MTDQPITADQILSGDLAGTEIFSSEQSSCSLPSGPPSSHPAHLFQKGQSGHPGRVVRSADEKESRREMMEQIRSLGPKTYAAMLSMLDSDRVQAMAKVKLIEIILSYILGKPESKVDLKVTTEEHIIAAETRIQALIQSIRIGKEVSSSGQPDVLGIDPASAAEPGASGPCSGLPGSDAPARAVDP